MKTYLPNVGTLGTIASLIGPGGGEHDNPMGLVANQGAANAVMQGSDNRAVSCIGAPRERGVSIQREPRRGLRE